MQIRTALVNQLRAVLLREGLVDRRQLARTPSDAWLETLVLPPRAAGSVGATRRLLAAVRTECARADRAVGEAATDDAIVMALRQIPGIGPVVGLIVRAEVGDIRRFPTVGHLASYEGLVPRVEASASRIHYGRITRRGSPWLRWALVDAALHSSRRPDRVGRWTRPLAIKKGALKARVAAARHLCTEIYTTWSALAGRPLQEGLSEATLTASLSIRE